MKMDCYSIEGKSISQKVKMIIFEEELSKSIMIYHQLDTQAGGKHMNLSLEIIGGQGCQSLCNIMLQAVICASG